MMSDTMTVEQLIKTLESLPSDLEVMWDDPIYGSISITNAFLGTEGSGKKKKAVVWVTD